jgi:hypothetical protein
MVDGCSSDFRYRVRRECTSAYGWNRNSGFLWWQRRSHSPKLIVKFNLLLPLTIVFKSVYITGITEDSDMIDIQRSQQGHGPNVFVTLKTYPWGTPFSWGLRSGSVFLTLTWKSQSWRKLDRKRANELLPSLESYENSKVPFGIINIFRTEKTYEKCWCRMRVFWISYLGQGR